MTTVHHQTMALLIIVAMAVGGRAKGQGAVVSDSYKSLARFGVRES